MKQNKLLLLLFVFSFTLSFGQISIRVGNSITENFNSIGTAAGATLPNNWKASKITAVKSVSPYSSAGTTTNYVAGINMSSSAANGIYNFEVGNGSTTSDRAIGGISSGSGSKSVNIYCLFKNDGLAVIKRIDISYDVMRFRNGSNSAGFSFQLFFSKNGIDWKSAGDNFLTSFTPNADNNGAAIVPIEMKSVLNQTLDSLAIEPGDSLYLAWNYSVSSGSTTSSAQALGIDNFVMNNISSDDNINIPETPLSKTASNITSSSFTANWNSSVGATSYYLDVSTSEDFSTFISGYNNLNVGNKLTYDITSLFSNTRYYYRVRAGNNVGTSSSSNTITVTTLSIYTTVQFSTPSDAISKVKGSYDLTLSITNPSPNIDTKCLISFVADSSSAANSYINNFSNQYITFSAGNFSQQTVKLVISNDGVSEIPKKAFFKITEVSGGTDAKIGNQGKFVLSITSGIDKNYYSTIADNISGDSLKSALHNLIKNNIKFPYTDSGTDIWKILKVADEDPKNQNNVLGIYSGLSIAKDPQSYWNREHVWSKSHGNFGTDIGAGTDAHNLRPENPNVNSIKSNLDFDEGGNAVPGAPLCKYDLDSWEPRDDVKGDVARIIFYMATRYQGDAGEPKLTVVDYIPSAPTNIEPYYGKLNTLLKWNTQDPPDDAEINRNNIVYYYQKNRNPFVDYPEWVTAIWGIPNNIQGNNNDVIGTKYSLFQNYPNPFNPSTIITFEIPNYEHITLKLFNALGKEIATLINENRQAGFYNYKLTVDKLNLASGIYFYQLRSNNFVETKKLVYLK